MPSHLNPTPSPPSALQLLLLHVIRYNETHTVTMTMSPKKKKKTTHICAATSGFVHASDQLYPPEPREEQANTFLLISVKMSHNSHTVINYHQNVSVHHSICTHDGLMPQCFFFVTSQIICLYASLETQDILC